MELVFFFGLPFPVFGHIVTTNGEQSVADREGELLCATK